jgi:cobalt/nickel transport system ATP-binding protein
MSDAEVILEVSNISFAYQQDNPILDDFTFHLHRGEKVGLVGDNGSGKTTFFHLIMGLLKPVSGTIKVFGKEAVDKKDFVAIRQRVGLLFQDADDQLFSPTVIEDVAFGPLNQGKSVSEAKHIASAILDKLGIPELEQRVTHQLSGGEKKLVSLATVLAMSPELLLLDEPTNGLDKDTKAGISKILKGLDLPYIVISHEYDFLSSVTDFSYFMKEGRIVAEEGETVHSHYHVHRFGVYPHQHAS